MAGADQGPKRAQQRRVRELAVALLDALPPEQERRLLGSG